MALIRYPGSKEKLADAIIKRMPHEVQCQLWSSAVRWEYREPFFGAGAVGLRILKHLHPDCKIWLNDIDYWLVCMWNAIRNSPGELNDMIDAFEPSADAFYRLKESDGSTAIDPVLAGFNKFALHMTSFSGLGAMAGGPLGGKSQKNPLYNPSCRWRPQNHKNDVLKYARLLQKFDDIEITKRSFEQVIRGAGSKCFIYCDPPYYEKGPQLYKYSMSDEQHELLAQLLKKTRAAWAASYDDHPFIRELYDWADISELEVTYTTATSRSPSRRKNKEILITPKDGRHAATTLV